MKRLWARTCGWCLVLFGAAVAVIAAGAVDGLIGETTINRPQT